MFAGQECLFGSIRACVPLAYLKRSCAHTPVCGIEDHLHMFFLHSKSGNFSFIP